MVSVEDSRLSVSDLSQAAWRYTYLPVGTRIVDLPDTYSVVVIVYSSESQE